MRILGDTERRKAEQIIQDARGYAESIVDTVREPLIVLDKDLHVITVNRSFYQTFKVTPEETQGQLLYDLGSKQWDIPKLRELLEEILPKSTKFDNFEVEHEFKDIGRRIMLLNARKIYREANNANMILLAIEDVTDRKKVEEELKRSNELKSLFADILSHDLLNPAGIVKGFTELLLEMEHDEKKVHLLETIERNNDKLMDMIKTASEFAKLENIEEIEFKDLDIGSVVAEVIADFKTQLEEKKMDVELRAKGEYPAKANPAIEEVFANLISNAIKYSPVQSKTIIDITDEGDLWKVTVTDFGEGISEEDKPKLFERFKRVGKGGVKGTGLGLAIVKRIIDLHGGSVGVEDNPEGNGSVFWVTVKKT